MQNLGKRLKIGDVFEVALKDNTKEYVQYIANDISQLNSDVVRVFKKRYPLNSSPTLGDILSDEVGFYSHVVDVKHGEKDGTWKKIGNSSDIGDLEKPLFRGTHDMGLITTKSLDKVSKKWYVWKIGKETRNTDDLSLLKQSDIGFVTWPDDIVIKMITGKYEGFYPNISNEK